jgi:hypothetical protein
MDKATSLTLQFTPGFPEAHGDFLLLWSNGDLQPVYCDPEDPECQLWKSWDVESPATIYTGTAKHIVGYCPVTLIVK